MVKRGVAFDPVGNVIIEPVVTPDLVEQLIDQTRNFADTLDRALTAQTSQGLRFAGRRAR